ncbi:hypothetical protein ScPMuIL_018984 [Solemya velum]
MKPFVITTSIGQMFMIGDALNFSQSKFVLFSSVLRFRFVCQPRDIHLRNILPWEIMANEVEIDDSLYSRQLYVLGDSAMKQMAQSSILLYGMGGLGIEIAKNITLAGIKSLTIQDGKTANVSDLGTQFFLREEDVTKEANRAEASCKHLSELNPYVTINVLASPLDDSSDLMYLKQFQCVILTEVALSTQIKVDNFCRIQSPPIKFISADVFGVFCQAFCDFGDEFGVVDPNGEELKEVFISTISKANPGEVTCLENTMHELESGDMVTFKEVKGMSILNGKTCEVHVKSPSVFTICDTSGEEFEPYRDGGIACQLKVPKTVTFQSLETQLDCPSVMVPDLGKLQAPANIHLGILALREFQGSHKRLPNVWCQKDAAELLSFAELMNVSLNPKLEDPDIVALRGLSFTCRGCFAPLCATLGGIVAQEGLKALTGKFTPLNQWLYLDAMEVLNMENNSEPHLFEPRGDRYDPLRICIGESRLKSLADLRLFMVGCGAIGCEMLKNYAMLGIGTGDEGKITITDNDLIEKSNLNRQFLFRPQHIRHPKSTIAAQSAVDINPGMKIEAQQYRVCPQTEERVYTDQFFASNDLIVNALDNVEARRYVDSRCVSNQRPLLESGTMGPKAHVQVIVPHLTESYGSQRDPPDMDVPYCTLKSFPANIEHCIQWARDKFESSFVQKPNLFNKFWSIHKPLDVIEKMKAGITVDGSIQVGKLLYSRPQDWQGCVKCARLKFEKYFSHKAKHLLHAFPLDCVLNDGSPFWQSPKRPPIPLEFDPENPLHLSFVRCTGRMYADIAGVHWAQQDMDAANIKSILHNFVVPDFVPRNKRIITDETVSKEEAPPEVVNEEEVTVMANHVEDAVKVGKQKFNSMQSAEFEKDDDSNGHIDFIVAASNLRASMYSIECADKLKVKRIAGRIVPAIATTTAAVSGLVTVELLKVVERMPTRYYKNCFLNLALPIMLLSEPGPPEKTEIRDGLTFTLWDLWEIKGTKDFTLKDFIAYFQKTYGLEAGMVAYGTRIVFAPFMPGHMKRLPQTMVKLLKPPAGRIYMDLVVAFQDDVTDNIPSPPVRYFFGL